MRGKVLGVLTLYQGNRSGNLVLRVYLTQCTGAKKKATKGGKVLTECGAEGKATNIKRKE